MTRGRKPYVTEDGWDADLAQAFLALTRRMLRAAGQAQLAGDARDAKDFAVAAAVSADKARVLMDKRPARVPQALPLVREDAERRLRALRDKVAGRLAGQ